MKRGTILRQYRLENADRSLREMAKAVGLTPLALNDMENGKREPWTIGKLIAEYTSKEQL